PSYSPSNLSAESCRRGRGLPTRPSRPRAGPVFLRYGTAPRRAALSGRAPRSLDVQHRSEPHHPGVIEAERVPFRDLVEGGILASELLAVRRVEIAGHEGIARPEIHGGGVVPVEEVVDVQLEFEVRRGSQADRLVGLHVQRDVPRL